MSWTDHYSSLDRLVHRAAFAGIELQKAIADIEDTVFRSRLASVPCQRPVFITSLPRAGTTLLLERLSAIPTFATHTYRNMPFLLCPLFWDQLSRGFRKSGRQMERAHGDGILIDFDSAEAFEEALWQAWWPDKYRYDRIGMWCATDNDDAFDAFLNNHMRKVIALGRRNKFSGADRYLSKNNANIARIEKLTTMFPDCTIVVPVREPRGQVASLHRQHLRFLEAHDQDGFARHYMRAIGHLDFGVNLAPIDFPNFVAETGRADTMPFWLDYWIAAYGMLSKLDCSQLVFVSYASVCARPAATLSRLLDRLDAPGAAEVDKLAAAIRPRERAFLEVESLDSSRLTEADTIYHELTVRAQEL